MDVNQEGRGSSFTEGWIDDIFTITYYLKEEKHATKNKESIKEMSFHFIFVRIIAIAHIRSCNGYGNPDVFSSKRRFKSYHILLLFISTLLYLILLSIFFPFSSLSSVLITNASIALLIAIFVCPYRDGKRE